MATLGYFPEALPDAVLDEILYNLTALPAAFPSSCGPAYRYGGCNRGAYACGGPSARRMRGCCGAPGRCGPAPAPEPEMSIQRGRTGILVTVGPLGPEFTRDSIRWAPPLPDGGF